MTPGQEIKEINKKDLIALFFQMGFRLTFWPQIGDDKGPRREEWPQEQQTIDDYHEGNRVGALTGVEIEPGKFLHDADLDWAPGALIAQSLLPITSFVYGRPSKKISHCFYTLPAAIPSVRYEDPVDKACLIELRGTKKDGTIGMQSMIPPSTWTKNGAREDLCFVRLGAPSFMEDAQRLPRRVLLSAISMLLAKHLGINGFGHERRLCWAGFLSRLGVTAAELIDMGEAISVYCNNREISDVRHVVDSTVAGLASKDNKKITGGPALAKEIGANGRIIIDQIRDWLGQDRDFVRDANTGKIVAKNQQNIKRAIELLGHELSCDEFAGKMLFDRRPLDDPQWKGLYLAIDQEFHMQPPIDYFKMVIEDAAWQNRFHPVLQYLDGLVWDGQRRIDEWLIQAAGAETSRYTKAISAIMLIAAVRRVRHPGCKYDEMVVWESAQGLKKSSAAQALCPNPAWFSDDLRLNLHGQELIEATLGKWIIEASDLAGRRRTEREQLKAMMSRQVDGPARMAYAHFPVERPRHFIIIGTTNSPAYLTDPTGARRFWPVAVKRFDVNWIIANRDQLWAEACVREAAGESIRLAEELWPEAAAEQEKRHEGDPWEDAIRETLLEVEANADGKRRVTTSSLWNVIGVPPDRQDQTGGRRIAEIMQRLGFKMTNVRVQGEKPKRGYVSVEAGDPKLRVNDADGEAGDRLVGEEDVPF